MKKLMLILLLGVSVMAFSEERGAWTNQAKRSITTAQITIDRHQATIDLLSNTTDDIEKKTRYDELWTAFYRTNRELSNLEFAEKSATGVDNRKKAHDATIAKKAELDRAFTTLKQFVDTL
jgi:P2-related tail formation protein